MAWNPDSPFVSPATLGETHSGARHLPSFLCEQMVPGRVLVLGASEVALAAAADHEVVVLDWNRRRLTELQHCAHERGLKLDVVCRDPDRQDLGIPPRTLANVVCIDILERSQNDVALLSRVAEKLLPDGRLILRVRAGAWVREETGRTPGPTRSYDGDTLRAVLDEAGLRTLRLRHWNLIGIPAALLWERMGARPQRGASHIPVSEQPRHWWDPATDLWFRAVENHISFPLGVSLVAVGTPLLERVPGLARVRPALRARPGDEACEPMTTSR